MSFEARVARLDEIARQLDSSELELATALQLFEEGVELLRAASEELKVADGAVKLLVEKLDATFELADFPA